MTTQIHTLTISVIHCAQCSMAFGLTVEFEALRRKDKKSFYCPAGHTQYFPGKTREQELEAQLKRAQEDARWEAERRAALDDIVKSERRSHAATKGQLTRTKNRIHKGVCPHCNRTFPDVTAHMQSKHRALVDAPQESA